MKRSERERLTRRAAYLAGKIPEIAWHYTNQRGSMILQSQVILLENTVEERVEDLFLYATAEPARFARIYGRERQRYTKEEFRQELLEYENDSRVVWFSTNQFWEKTAKYAVVNGQPRGMEGSMRFGVPTASLEKWLESDVTGPKAKKVLIENADGASPEEWYVSRTEVPIFEWVSIQEFVAGAWREVRNNEGRTVAECNAEVLDHLRATATAGVR